MVKERLIAPRDSSLQGSKLRDVGRSLAGFPHREVIQFNFGVPDFVWVAEKGEELLLKLIPVVKDGLGVNTVEEIEVGFKPLQGLTSKIRGGVDDSFAVIGEGARVVGE